METTEIRLTDQDAYVLRRAIARKDVTNLVMSPGVALLVQALCSQTTEVRNELVESIFKIPGLAQHVYQFDPDAPAPNPKSDDIYIPPLPYYAQLTSEAVESAKGACPWHNDFVEWARQRSPMTPSLFLEIGGLYLISLAIARRVCLPLHDRIFPHIYVLWIAETTRHAKSTGLKCVQEVALQAIPHMLMPHQSTPEALLETMAGKLPENLGDLQPWDRERIERGRVFAAQRGILLDEASSLLGAAKKDYMAGLSEWLLEAYDGPEYKERMTKGNGLLVVNRLGLNILGATTPAAIARTVTHDKWEDGEMARYLLAYPEEQLPFTDKTGETDPPPNVIATLRQLHNSLPLPGSSTNAGSRSYADALICANLAPDAQIAYQNYRQAMMDMTNDNLETGIAGNYGRLPIQGIKAALAFSVMESFQRGSTEAPVVQMAHWARAQQLVERTRASIHRLLPVVNESFDNRAQTRILALLKQSPSGLTKRNLSKRTQIPTRSLEAALEVLLDSGTISAHNSGNAKGGPRTIIYYYVAS